MAKVRSMSIFKKTGLLAFCLFGVISTLTSALTAYTLYERMTEEYISKGSAITKAIAGASQETLLNRDAATVQALIDQYLEIQGVAYVFVVDADSKVVSHTFVPQMPPRLAMIRESKGNQWADEIEIESYGRVIDICEPILAGVAGYVHVGMDKGLIMDYFWVVVFKMQILLFFIFWGCVGTLYLVTRRISRPLTQLTEYAEKLAAHDFSARIEIKSNDELGLLGRTMESMANELSTLFTEMESEISKATGDLREHMVYLSAIIDNLADGLLVVSPMGTVTVINPAMREFFDLGDKDYRGFAASDVFPTEVSDLTTAIRICNSAVQMAEIPLSRGRTGKSVGSSICIEEPSKQCLGGVLLVRDITREKELDQLKTDFISTVSHELRTPMTSVLGFAKIIRKKLETAVFPFLMEKPSVGRTVSQIQDNMEIIVSEAERLTELINDVLDIAKMEAGEVQWRDQVVFMTDVIRQSFDSTRGIWKSKGIEVVSELDTDLLPVRGDRSRLVQVMVNLISNAVKFTENSPIICRVQMDGNTVLVSVSDNGAGIAEENLNVIFDKFKQAGDTLTEKPEGTGLGLPICRQIVEHHGGRIWAESEPGKGSIFFFSLPTVRTMSGDTAVVPEDCKKIMPEPDSAMLVREVADNEVEPLILVVDDDPTLGLFLTQVFEEQGFRVLLAVNGEEAIEMARDFIPNLITMDLMMPGMDGHTAIKCLRHNPFTRHIPILVLSALTDGSVAGGDIALTKPIDDTHLVEIARALLLEKDVRRSCLVLGDSGEYEYEDLTVICPEMISYCPPVEIWKYIEEGFTGTIFIPAEISEQVDIDLLARAQDIVVVILPTFEGREK
ncbi:MAG: response regulator [Pseudodesulfovibrio sp.]|nr:response regulator [Pseudodesulfovibrio sp.]